MLNVFRWYIYMHEKCICIYKYACFYIQIDVFIHKYVYLHIYTYIFIYVICIHTYILYIGLLKIWSKVLDCKISVDLRLFSVHSINLRCVTWSRTRIAVGTSFGMYSIYICIYMCV
jgi:hypothetical protein